jgi:hypothetical protein
MVLPTENDVKADARRKYINDWKKAKRKHNTQEDKDREANRKRIERGLKGLENLSSPYRKLNATQYGDFSKDKKQKFYAPLKIPNVCSGKLKYPKGLRESMK